ncbi:CLUMA_CG016862, isoform A [Clunio marinus]|uniref:CLUMA_CG016862, isoform A n=1 Tax=Clunio marinus TaxID=568069 RepID=A0A1J1ISD2_9DIPT|nr:CLUMA_CG016862, isoform A [Clunio marinus]
MLTALFNVFRKELSYKKTGYNNTGNDDYNDDVDDDDDDDDDIYSLNFYSTSFIECESVKKEENFVISFEMIALILISSENETFKDGKKKMRKSLRH